MELIRLTHRSCGAVFITRADCSSQICPSCRVGFDIATCDCEPLPCPFSEQHSVTCAVVVKPTCGSFLEYRMGDDLHIGVSDSKSTVHSFWLNGITSETVGWDGSMIVCQFNNDEERFDQSLVEFINASVTRFSWQSYDDKGWNCFDFVIAFMRSMNLRDLTKAAFVSEYVQKGLSTAIKYCALVRRIEEHDCVMI